MVLAQWGMERNARFSPLIAVNPAYHHPLEFAKRLISLLHCYPNRIALNLVTGSFSSEMKAIGETLDFDLKMERLREYVEVLQTLLSGSRVDFQGKFYQLSGAHVLSAIGRRSVDYFLSGSAAPRLSGFLPDAYFVSNLRPRAELAQAPGKRAGLLLGIVARPGKAEAEAAVQSLYPPDRKGEMLFSIASSNNDSPWNQWLRDYLKNHPADDPDFHLGPMLRFQAPVPYLVGSYEEVAERLNSCVELGYGFFLVDFLPGEEDHVSECIRHVRG
jgi:alkanesulfonate monooxygenase